MNKIMNILQKKARNVADLKSRVLLVAGGVLNRTQGKLEA
jgi:hypothetical protein